MKIVLEIVNIFIPPLLMSNYFIPPIFRPTVSKTEKTVLSVKYTHADASLSGLVMKLSVVSNETAGNTINVRVKT